MTNPKKKKKQVEILEVWEELKEKIRDYQDTSLSSKIIRARDDLITDYKDKLRNYENQLQNHKDQLQNQDNLITSLQMKWDNHTCSGSATSNSATSGSSNLEKKLERVRNLIADNQIEKLKRLCKRGEI